MGYAYDRADNLSYRTNNALVQAVNTDNLNQLSPSTRTGAMTVSGTTGGAATSVMVSGQSASLYGDQTFGLAGVALDDGTNTFTAVAQDRYSRHDTNTVTAYLTAQASFQYDSNGNLLSHGQRSFDYDDENQLIRVTLAGAWKSEFVYDGQGRRRIRRDYTWQNSTWAETSEVRYVYDGSLMIQERGTNNFPVVSYTRGLDLGHSLDGAGGIGGLLARTAHSQLMTGDLAAHCFYHADANGNVTCLANSACAIVAKYLYDPYGNTLALSGPLADVNPMRISSKEWNENAGLYYYGRRYYDPNLQRWPCRDLLGEPGGANLYAFCGGDPVNATDPLGMWVIGQPWSGGWGDYYGTAIAEKGDTLQGLASLIIGPVYVLPPLTVDVQPGQEVMVKGLLIMLENKLRESVVSETANFSGIFGGTAIPRQATGSATVNQYFGNQQPPSGTIDCWSACAMVYAKSIIDVIGASMFDILALSDYTLPIMLASSMPSAPPEGPALFEMKPGDWAYFRNYGGVPEGYECQGENVIKVGTALYWGFAGGPRGNSLSYGDWQRRLRVVYRVGMGRYPTSDLYPGYVGTTLKFIDVASLATGVFTTRRWYGPFL